jgi:putative membrane protein
MNQRFRKALCITIFFGGLTVGCRASDRDALVGTPSGSAPAARSEEATPAPSSQTLNDAQILGVLRTVNQSALAIAEVATQKAVTDEVRAFAQRALLELPAANDKVSAELGATGPEDSEIATRLQEKGAAELAKLNALEGVAFEKAYIQGQIAMHQELLRTIDEKLFPATGTTTVRNLLQTARNGLSAQLAQAKAVETGLPETTPAV